MNKTERITGWQKIKAPITILAFEEPMNHLFPSRRLDGRYALILAIGRTFILARKASSVWPTAV
jgi:hypothetical protein